MKVVNWNVQWATPASVRSPEILRRVECHTPEVVCLAETDYRLLSALDGHVISAGHDSSPAAGSKQRKVLLWSRCRWADADEFRCEASPPGRFVSGTTETFVGRTTVVGVGIPNHNASLNVGAKDKTPWKDRCPYLHGLSSIVSGKSPAPLIVLGDFNHHMGQRRRPCLPLSHPVRTGLQETMAAVGPDHSHRRTGIGRATCH